MNETNMENEDNPPEINDFYFESDHLALRGNKDYSNILRTIAIYSAEKKRILKCLEDLKSKKEYFTNNPEEFLRKIQNNEEIVESECLKIPELPKIGVYETIPVKIKREQENETENVIASEVKPDKINKFWTCEEQRQLEQLLIKYPAEEYESRRFAKIAKALGNRTPQQVSSRVQKYFQKLASAGLPIPGRIPKNIRQVQARGNKFNRPTTFFPSQMVPVKMEDDDLDGNMLAINNPAASQATNIVLPKIETEDLEKLSQERVLKMLKAICDEKKENKDGYNPDPMAAICEACTITPISRTHWYCNTCYCYLNLCADCLCDQLIKESFEHILHDVIVKKGEL